MPNIDEADVTWDFEGNDHCSPYGHLADGTFITRESDGTLRPWKQAYLRNRKSPYSVQQILAEMREQLV